MRGQELGQDQLEWFQNWYRTDGAAQRNAEAELNKTVIDDSMGISADQRKIANETAAYQRDVFRPLERGIVADAQNFSTKDYGERKASDAAAQAEQAVAQAQQAVARDQARRGVAPSAGVAAALAQQVALRGAAVKASAATGARDNAEQVGFARRMDAARLGSNLSTDAARAAQISLSAGGQASAVLAGQGAGMRADASILGSGYESAIRANQGAAGTLGNTYATYAQGVGQSNANRAGMAGTGAGIIAAVVL